MKEFAVIPITKMELTKAIFIIAFVVPIAVVFYIGTWDGLGVLVFLIFPTLFLFLFKDELGWDFGIKIKFFEGRE